MMTPDSAEEDSEVSVANSGDATASKGGVAVSGVVTGGVTVEYHEHHHPAVVLEDASALHTSAFVAGLDLGHYEERPWLTDQLDRAIAELGSGYVVVEGEAGVGKSAFLVHHTLERHWVHHYCGVNEGSRPDVALRNLAQQLINVYRPDIDSGRGSAALSSPAGLVEGDAFHDLLRRCAERHAAEGRPGPLILAVDGIERAQIRNGMPLSLPQSLPDNVVVVATSQQGRLRLQVPSESRRIIPLRAAGEDNRADIRRHVGRLADEFADRLATAGVSQRDFIDVVTERVGGLWIYLRYIAADIRSERRALDDLGSLPRDLWEYYAHTLASDREPDSPERWYRWSLPLLGALAAARGPLTVDALGTYSGVPEQWRVLERLENTWPGFLSRVTDGTGTTTYAVYHSSVSDFVNGNVSRDGDVTLGADEALSDELRRAARNAHDRIADYHLTAWGGLSRGLPLLPVAGRPDFGERYGLRHVIEHLDAAGRHSDIHHLLRLSAPGGPENVWFACHENLGTLEDYREHVAIGRRIAAARVDRSGSDRAEFMALEIRYMLMDSSLVELAAGIPANLLDRLVRANVWPLEKALFYARRNSDAADRASALLTLAEHLPDPEPIFNEVFRLALQEKDYTSSRIMDELVKAAPTDFLAQVSNVARTNLDSYLATSILAHVAARNRGSEFSEDLISAALRRAAEIKDSSSKVHSLLRVGEATATPALRNQALTAAEAAARRVERPDDAVRALIDVAADMDPGPAQDNLFREALEDALSIPVERNHTEFLYHMMPLRDPGEIIAEAVERRLPEPLLLEALPVIQRIRPRRNQGPALTALAARLSPDTGEDVYDEILEAAWTADPVACVTIAGMLPPALLDRARAVISSADDVNLAISASLDLLAEATDDGQAVLQDDIAKLLRWKSDPGERAGHLLHMAELVRDHAAVERLRSEYVQQLDLLPADDTRRDLGHAHLVMLEPPGRQRDVHLEETLSRIDRLNPELRLDTLLKLVDLAANDPAATERVLIRAFASTRDVPREHVELPYAREERRSRLMGVPGHRHRHADAWYEQVSDQYERPWLLSSVLRKTPPFLLHLAWGEIAKLPKERDRLSALKLIADELPEEALPAALRLARQRPSWGAAHILASASASMPEDQGSELCATALNLALAIPYNDLRSRTLYRIAESVARLLPGRIVEASRAASMDYFKAEVLRAGAENASPAHLEEILRAIHDIPDVHWLAYAAAPLLGRLPAGDLRQSLEQELRSFGMELRDQWARAAILTEIVTWADPSFVVELLPNLRPNLAAGRWVEVGGGIASSDGFFWRELVDRVLQDDFPEAAMRRVLQDLMAAAANNTNPEWQAIAARYDALPAAVRDTFLRHAERLADVVVLAAVVSIETADHQEVAARRALKALEVNGTHGGGSVYDPVRAATVLAKTAPPSVLTDVAAVARKLPADDCCFPLRAVVQRLQPGEEREDLALEAFNSALKGVDRFQNSEHFAVLGDVARYLPSRVLPKVAELVRQLPNKHGDATRLALLIARTPLGEDARHDLVDWAIASINSDRDLVELIEAGPADKLPNLFELTMALEDDRKRVRCLLSLYGRTGSPDHLRAALAAMASAQSSISGVWDVEHALTKAPDVPIAAVRSICEQYLGGRELARVLCALAARSPDTTVRTDLLESSLNLTQAVRSASDRFEDLARVVEKADQLGVKLAWTVRWRVAWPDEAGSEDREAVLTALADNWRLAVEGGGAEAPAVVSLAVAEVLRWWS